MAFIVKKISVLFQNSLLSRLLNMTNSKNINSEHFLEQSILPLLFYSGLGYRSKLLRLGYARGRALRLEYARRSYSCTFEGSDFFIFFFRMSLFPTQDIEKQQERRPSLGGALLSGLGTGKLRH